MWQWWNVPSLLTSVRMMFKAPATDMRFIKELVLEKFSSQESF